MAQRNRKGQFEKGASGNPGGKPKAPKLLYQYGEESIGRLRAIADHKDTPVKVRADIERWFAEMTFGKPKLGVEMDGNLETSTTVQFEGLLEQWSK